MGGRHADAAPFVTICIVTGRRLGLLDALLASLQRQVETPPFEVLVCCDGDPDVAATVHARFPDARVHSVTNAHPGGARNVLLADARGEWLLFLDDDVTVRQDLLQRLASLAAKHPAVDVFGGPNDSPPDSTRFQFVQGAVMASIVGAGPVRRRYGEHPAGPADERFFILCNLAVRRRVMLPFDPDLVCAEENALLSEMSRRGIAMHYDPSLAVFHERRDSVAGFARQMFKYGRGRGQLMRRDPSTASLAYLVPSGLLLYGVVLPVLMACTRRRTRVAVATPLLAYAGVVGAGSAAIATTLRRRATLPVAAALIVELHCCYGAGVLRGLGERAQVRSEPEPVVSQSTDAQRVDRPTTPAALAERV
jgi:GT2 family glycosyltransferase